MPWRRVLAVAAIFVLAALSLRLLAQVEGERGIAPIASNGDFEVGGIAVETTGDSAEEAREKGWKDAQRLAWEKLWLDTGHTGKAPALAEGMIDSMVSAVVIEREQLGPRRYIASLGVIFDRARAGELLGMTGEVSRSAPLLVIPVQYSGGAAQLFEVRTPWQRAWAEYRTANSSIDYVRPNGAGGESLLLTAGQIDRRSRTWWTNILDQFGAADVIMPLARLERQFPGGPVKGTFTARYGPDNRYLGSFTMTAKDDGALPAMLNRAITQLDRLYSGALAAGVLRPDPTLRVSQPIDQALIDRILGAVEKTDAAAPSATSSPAAATPTATPVATISTITVQFATPDAGAVDAGLGSVRGTPGVQGASITSVAIGGTSVMRVSFAGDLDALRAALQSRGWQVQQGASALSIRR
ncbi:MAG TPA: heavy-metal-associated domain-containing protein [Novosphingobium sp.]|nr:heavy-metal-associated domain-containing protein [Novosphingobium sp.]